MKYRIVSKKDDSCNDLFLDAKNCYQAAENAILKHKFPQPVAVYSLPEGKKPILQLSYFEIPV